jgi:hypothetical protein
LETNQDRWNKVRSVEKELEELERDIENVSFRQLAELKRMCRRGYKIFSNQQEKKKKGEDWPAKEKEAGRRSIDLKEGRGGVITEDVCKRLRESVWLSFWGFLYRWGMKTKHHGFKRIQIGNNLERFPWNIVLTVKKNK